MASIWHPGGSRLAARWGRSGCGGTRMARSDRIMVTVSPAMTVALGMLAERNGLTVSAQATLTMRQALDRTMNSAECVRRLRQHTAQRNHATWEQDVTADRAVERLCEEATARAAGAASPMEGAS